jgi:hypothetical protein
MELAEQVSLAACGFRRRSGFCATAAADSLFRGNTRTTTCAASAGLGFFKASAKDKTGAGQKANDTESRQELFQFPSVHGSTSFLSNVRSFQKDTGPQKNTTRLHSMKALNGRGDIKRIPLIFVNMFNLILCAPGADVKVVRWS